MDEKTPSENSIQPESHDGQPTDLQGAGPDAGASSDRTDVAQLESQLTAIRAELDGERSLRERLGQDLQAAVASYREAVLAAAPDLPAEMVSGGTVTEVKESVQRARRLVEQVRATVESEARQSRIPAGAPARTAPDLNGLSAREKITRGLRDRQ